MRTNVAHCDSAEIGRPLPKRARQRAGVLAGQREVEVLHADEVELHRQLVAVLAAEERLLVLVRQVDLAEQDAVTGTPTDEGPQVAQVLVRVGEAVELGLRRRRSVSIMNGTASTRKPEIPSSSQKPIALTISSRTRGLVMLRSGWVR